MCTCKKCKKELIGKDSNESFVYQNHILCKLCFKVLTDEEKQVLKDNNPILPIQDWQSYVKYKKMFNV